MSTAQIYGKHGMLQYDDDYKEMPENYFQCERCRKEDHKDFMMFFYSKKQGIRKRQIKPASVCDDCWEKYYDFYEDDYDLSEETRDKIKRSREMLNVKC
jgi:hypothetical protein